MLLVGGCLFPVPVALISVPARIPESLLAVVVAVDVVGVVAGYAGYFH